MTSVTRIGTTLSAVTCSASSASTPTSADHRERVLPAPGSPMDVARELARERYQLDDGTPTLRHWRGGWWEWRGSHWAEVELRAARATAYAFTETAVYFKGDEIVP